MDEEIQKLRVEMAEIFSEYQRVSDEIKKDIKSIEQIEREHAAGMYKSVAEH